MIDHDDGDLVWVASMSTSGWVSAVLLVIAIGLWIVASGNEEECQKLVCQGNYTAQLVEGECMCVGKPVEP